MLKQYPWLRLAVLAAVPIASLCACGTSPSRPSAPVDPHPRFGRAVQVAERIASDYVDAVDPKQLIEGCRQTLQRAVPGAPDASGTGSLAEEIGRALPAARLRAPATMTDNALVDACIQGMVKTLERSTYYSDGSIFTAQPGDIGGTGIEIADTPKGLLVVAPYESTPAARAGIRAGDTIVRIDDTPIAGLPLTDSVERLRGKPGSEVVLMVERKGGGPATEVRLRREVIKIQNGKWTVLPPGIVYLQIKAFYEATTLKNLVTALAQASDYMQARGKGRWTGLILDLRGNPGGLFHTSIGVAAAFLPQGVLVTYTSGRTQDSKQRLYANRQDYVRNKGPDPLVTLPEAAKTAPMVVLVDRKTASGAEIVAAALQDHRRATVLGERTFGLGVLRTLLPMYGGAALDLATSRCYTPHGMPIGVAGIAPDIVLDGGKDGEALSPSPRPEDDPVVERAIQFLSDSAN